MLGARVSDFRVFSHLQGLEPRGFWGGFGGICYWVSWFGVVALVCHADSEVTGVSHHMQVLEMGVVCKGFEFRVLFSGFGCG